MEEHSVDVPVFSQILRENAAVVSVVSPVYPRLGSESVFSRDSDASASEMARDL